MGYATCTRLSISAYSENQPQSHQYRSVPAQSDHYTTICEKVVEHQSKYVIFESIGFIDTRKIVRSTAKSRVITNQILRLRVRKKFRCVSVIERQQPDLGSASAIQWAFTAKHLALHEPFITAGQNNRHISRKQPMINGNLQSGRQRRFGNCRIWKFGEIRYT